MSTKVSALTQATNAELAGALAYVVTDPSGTPASKKTLLSRLGLPPQYIADDLASIGTRTVSAGNTTTGQYFVTRRGSQTCIGGRVYWPGATARTLKISLWQDTVTPALATATVATTGAGVYSVTFGSPIALPRTTAFAITCWETSGTEQLDAVSCLISGSFYQNNPTTLGFRLQDYMLLNWGYSAAGDALIGTPNTGAYFPVDPLISG